MHVRRAWLTAAVGSVAQQHAKMPLSKMLPRCSRGVTEGIMYSRRPALAHCRRLRGANGIDNLCLSRGVAKHSLLFSCKVLSCRSRGCLAVPRVQSLIRLVAEKTGLLSCRCRGYLAAGVGTASPQGQKLDSRRTRCTGCLAAEAGQHTRCHAQDAIGWSTWLLTRAHPEQSKVCTTVAMACNLMHAMCVGNSRRGLQLDAHHVC